MRKIVLATAMLASSHAYACCSIPSPDMGAFYQTQPVQIPSYVPQQQELPMMPVPQQQQYHCRSVRTFGGWTTDCD